MISINNPIVGNYQQYLEDGYEISDVKCQRGYVSRKNIPNCDIPVYIVNRGKRTGDVFIIRPCFSSTLFCYRLYLRKF